MIVTAPITITRLFAEFTAAGDAASLLRLGIRNDDGAGKPGTLVLEAGSISTGTGNAGTVATSTPGDYELNDQRGAAHGVQGAVTGVNPKARMITGTKARA